MTAHREDTMSEPGSPAWVNEMADVMAEKEASLNVNLRGYFDCMPKPTDTEETNR